MRVRVFVCLFFLNIVALSAQDVLLRAWIDVQSENGQNKLEAKFISKLQNERTFSYKLITEKSGTNTSSNTQSGNFTATPNQERILSSTQIKITSQDCFKALLQIYFDKNLIAQDSVEIGIKTPAKSKQPKAKINPTTKIKQNPTPTPPSTPEPTSAQTPTKQPTPTPQSFGDNLEIDGLIIDETRTKVARDFYDYFYSNWFAPQNARDYAIKIKELPSRGRVARVTVEVNDKTLFTRVLQPRLELIEEMAKHAIRIVQKHLGENESLKKDLDESDTKGSGIF